MQTEEFPVIQKSWTKQTKSLAIVYPNLYYGGVYCLAPLVFYNIVNKHKNWICHRKFLDRQENLKNYNLIGFTFQYELDINNIKLIMQKHSLKDRITFAGGPVSNINPSILKNIVDFQVLGEVEETIPIILKKYEQAKTKQEFLKSIQNIQGVFTAKTKNITYAQNKKLTEKNYPICQPLPKTLTKEFVFGNSFLLETERGCPFNCKFCPISQIHKKIKYYPLTGIKKIIDNGIKLNKRNRIIIYSPSFTHPDKKQILKYIISKNLKASVPSAKIETLDIATLKLIRQLGQTTLTIAPECNQSIRTTLNKQTTDQQILNFLKQAKESGFTQIKAYFMLGLPSQTLEDIRQTIVLIQKMKDCFSNLYISFNSFVPKPGTLLANQHFRKQDIKQQIKYIKKNLKNTRYKIAGLQTSFLEYRIANQISS